MLASGAALTGATVHYVDEEYDRGPIIAQWPVPVRRDDTPDTLAARMAFLARETGVEVTAFDSQYSDEGPNGVGNEQVVARKTVWYYQPPVSPTDAEHAVIFEGNTVNQVVNAGS